MQLTQEQCDDQITKIQQQIPELQAQLQRLVGYKQALVEMEKSDEMEDDEALTTAAPKLRGRGHWYKQRCKGCMTVVGGGDYAN